MPDRFAPYMDPADVARARRAASKRGWRVEKSRDRIHANNRGLLRLIDPYVNADILGRAFDATPEDIIDYCWDHPASP